MSVQREQATFLNALRRASAELDSSQDPRDFALWSLTYIRAVQPRELRHAACDGVLEALDERHEQGPPSTQHAPGSSHAPAAGAASRGREPGPSCWPTTTATTTTNHGHLTTSTPTRRARRPDLAPSRFVERYRLARKPSYARLRRLDGSPLLAGGGPVELALRVADLMVTRLAPITWLRDRVMSYWGDIDTHGLLMLDRMRGHFPGVRSLLMNHDTLLSHELHWDVEQVQANASPDRLTPDEVALYRDLLQNRFGTQIRLKQERIRFSAVDRAVRADP